MITFRVYGEPKAQPRVRAFARKMGNGKFAARVYDPGTAEAWKSQIAEAAKPFIERTITNPVRLKLEFFMPRPKSHFGKKGLKPNAPQFHVSKPDLDNMEKAIKDALTQIHMWQDDCQVIGVTKRKHYAQDNAECGVIITIVEVNTL